MSDLSGARSDFFGILVKRGTETIQYEISDIYDQSLSGFTGDYCYYGYLNSIGDWIIQQQQLSTGQWRYIAGTGAYATFWANKVGLTYVTYDQIFN